MAWRVAQWKEGWLFLVGKTTTEEGGDGHCLLGICRLGKGIDVSKECRWVCCGDQH